MKYLLFILIITLFVNIEKSHLKCVMYDTCTNLDKLYETSDPLNSRWQNCEYNGEARPIENQEVMDMFKQLCPSMYNGNDKMPLCCSANQIRILRKSIKEAESIIGTCPSCYFNFRNFWCQITCHPEQDKFVVPTIYKLSEYRNFTEQFKMHESAKDQIEEDHEELEHDDEEEKEVEKPKEKKYAVSRMSIYFQREFISELIESCHDVKLYGSDALQGFCGVPSKQCTPENYVNHMGLVVTQNPFKIDFYIDKTHEEIIPIRQIREVMDVVEKEETHDFTIRPILPKYYKCNESFQFGDLDYGAKCSCKACQASCEIYPEFRIAKKRHFKVGHVDGAVFIMSIAFVIFIAFFTRYLFIKKLEPKKIHTNNSISSSMDSTETTTKYQEKTLFTKLLHIICLCPKTPRKLLIPAETEPDSNNSNSSPQKNRSKYSRLFRNRLNKLNFLDKMLFFGDKLERFIELRFQYLGKFCATYPTLVLTIGFAFCSLMCLGYFNFKVEKDPIKLWSADSSIARQNKKYFDENFGPFYRITQLIIEPKKSITPTHYKNINITSLKIEILKETFDLYNQLIQIKEPISLDKICFKPMDPENQNCTIQSIFQYFQNDLEKFESLTHSEEDLYKYLQSCLSNPLELECLSSFGAPIQPYLIIGSYDTTKTEYLNAGALIINFVINNYLNNEDKISKAMQWEFEALKILKNYTSDLINVYYSTERSIEDELERESKADIKIIAISYVVMFVYLTITLGKYSSLNIKVIFLEMKIFLALAGVSLVILSVFSSGGFFASIGVPSTLITLEVIPFLLLAVGVDNVYILVQTYQNDEKLPNESIEDQISRIVGRVGPSMLLTGTTQSAAFLISALTPMPGVRAFSLYASLAIIINFIMQITCFVVLLTLDAKREQSRRIDLLCCFKLNLKNFEIQNRKSFLYKFFKKFYTPILFDYKVRVGVIVVFVGFFFSCLTMCDKIKVGLDQKLTMPQDSYQLKYFEALQKHLSVGPPVYFVLKDGYNYTNLDDIRKLCGSSSCESNSLQSLISSASFFPNETYIAQPPENWIDNYMEWLEATSPSYCCYEYKKKKEFCDYIKLNASQEHECEQCKFERVKYNFPDENSLLKYVKYFLKQNPSRDCIKAGHAMYGDAVRLHQNKNGHVTSIGPSHFMAYHKVLSTSDDFINAMKSAHKISEAINKILNSGSNSSEKIEVFPYSIFYVFYEQYLTIWQDATMQLILTLFAIFLCTFILLSFDLYTALIVTGLIAIIIIDMVGIMFLWNIELNAISLVNLVIAIGISVEFCSHIARAYAISNADNRIERATEALSKMGPPVFSGVLQSIVGISVLAFAHSQLFQVFYFRMYISILVLGLTHGLIFLPVLLTFIGRSTNHLALFRSIDINDFEIRFSKNDSDSSNPRIELENNKSSKDHEAPNCESRFEVVEENEFEEDDDDFRIKKEFLRLPDKSKQIKLNKKFDRDSPVSRDCLLNENDSNNSQEMIENEIVDQQLPIRTASLSIPIKSKKSESENDESNDILSKSFNYKSKIISFKPRSKSTSEPLSP